MPPDASQHHVTLVAMPPSGEVFVARDDDGVLWLVPPAGAGVAEPVDEKVVEQAIVDHGFERIEASFPSWDLLDAERQRRAGEGLVPAAVNFTRFDRDDIRRLLRALGRARADGQIGRARRFAHRLLTAPVLREDDELYDRVVTFLQELDDIATPLPPTVRREPHPERVEAYERVHLQAA